MSPLSEPEAPRCLEADRGDHGKRLDHVLMRHLQDLHPSRGQIQGWIREGRARLNGTAARAPSRRLQRGDRLEVMVPPPPSPAPPPAAEDLPWTCLYQDEHLVAVSKPPGQVVHPTAGHREATLLHALAWHRELWEGGRPRLVQRLDAGTSGVLLVARTREAHARLARALREPEAAKEYLALVHGAAPVRKGEIRSPLARDERGRSCMVVDRHKGRPALTRYELLATVDAGGGSSLSLLACRLGSGRMHQIRVHLATAGLPLAGDPLYGDPVRDRALGLGLPRQALHSWRLRFEHPFSPRRLEIEAPLPPDLSQLWGSLGLLPLVVGSPSEEPGPQELPLVPTSATEAR